MEHLSINLKDINCYVISWKYLENKYKKLLNKNEHFEICGAQSDNLYFRIIDKNTHNTVTSKYIHLLKEEYKDTDGIYCYFKDLKLRYFKKRAISKDTYSHIVNNYIIWITYLYSTVAYDDIDFKLGKGKTFENIYIKNGIINQDILTKLTKVGIEIKQNKRFTHFNFKSKAKEIYTCLKLLGEINATSY